MESGQIKGGIEAMTGIEQGRTSPNRLGSLVRSLAVTGIEPNKQLSIPSSIGALSAFLFARLLPLLSTFLNKAAY
jgi:hypothetical protein